MNFVTRVLEDVCALLTAFMLTVVLIAYFGSSPMDRYKCDLKTTNVIADTVCIFKTTAQS